MKAVARLTPSTAAAYFEYRIDTNQLVCVHVSDEALSPLLGTAMRPGERVTGWAAVNLTTVANSNAALDLGDAATLLSVPVWSMISAPVLGTTHADLRGVLSGYAVEPGAYSTQDIRLFEGLADELVQFGAGSRPDRRSPAPFRANTAEVAG